MHSGASYRSIVSLAVVPAAEGIAALQEHHVIDYTRAGNRQRRNDRGVSPACVSSARCVYLLNAWCDRDRESVVEYVLTRACARQQQKLRVSRKSASGVANVGTFTSARQCDNE